MTSWTKRTRIQICTQYKKHPLRWKQDPSLPNGQKMNNFTIMNINKGDSLLQNRELQLNHLINMYKPTMFSINELNLQKKNYRMTPNAFPGYFLENYNLCNTDNMSRTGILIANGTKYKRRRDLEARGTAVVWLQVQPKGRKPFLVQSIYRQFQRLDKPGSGSIIEQTKRWESVIKKWVQANDEKKEIITVANLNLNYLVWNLNESQMSLHEKSQAKMMQHMKTRITTQGHSVINKKAYTKCRIT